MCGPSLFAGHPVAANILSGVAIFGDVEFVHVTRDGCLSGTDPVDQKQLTQCLLVGDVVVANETTDESLSYFFLCCHDAFLICLVGILPLFYCPFALWIKEKIATLQM